MNPTMIIALVAGAVVGCYGYRYVKRMGAAA